MKEIARSAGGRALQVDALRVPGATAGQTLVHNGTEFLPAAAPASGGTHGSGTLAARPASPAAGDTYQVTSGAGVGTVSVCFVGGDWNDLLRAGVAIDMDGTRIHHLDEPSAVDDAATKNYVDVTVAALGVGSATVGHAWERPAPIAAGAGARFVNLDDLTEQVSTGLAVSPGVAASGWMQRLPTGFGSGRASLQNSRAYALTQNLTAYTLGAATVAVLFRWDGTQPSAGVPQEFVTLGDNTDEQRGIHILLAAGTGATTNLIAYTGEQLTVLKLDLAVGWHALAVQAFTGNAWRFRLDGTVYADVAMTAAYVAPGSADSFGIGTRPDGGLQATSVQVADVMAWPSLLSAADLLALATIPVPATYELPESASTGAASIRAQANRYDPNIPGVLPARGIPAGMTVGFATKVTL